MPVPLYQKLNIQFCAYIYYNKAKYTGKIE